MTPEQALKNLWQAAMEANLPLKNYPILAESLQVLEAAIKIETKQEK